MAGDEVIIRTDHEGVFYQVALSLVLFLDGIHLIGVGIIGTICTFSGSRLGTLVLEETLQRLPRLTGQEIFLAQRVYDDVELE